MSLIPPYTMVVQGTCSSNFCSTHFGGLKSNGKWPEILPLHFQLSWALFWALWTKLQPLACVHPLSPMTSLWYYVSDSNSRTTWNFSILISDSDSPANSTSEKYHICPFPCTGGQVIDFPPKFLCYEVITLGWTFGPFRAYFPCTQSVSNLLLFWC